MTVQRATNMPPEPRRGATETSLQLDAAVNMIDLARADANKVLRALPATAPLFGCVDLVTAICHLKQASVLIDQVADLLDAEAAQR